MTTTSGNWLSTFFSGSETKEIKKTENGAHADEEDMFTLVEPDTVEQQQSQKLSSMKAKIRDELKIKPAQPGSHFNYESIFRPIMNIFTDGPAEGSDGVGVSISRQAMNASIGSKFSFAGPQHSGWDFTLQSHGFSDSVMAMYNSTGRYQLMYQRVLKMGGLMMGQWAVMPGMALPGMGAAPGNFFGMIEYPWRQNGTTSLTYLKGRSVTVSHAERLIRGVHVGVCMNYAMDTHATTNAYAIQTVTSDRKTTVAMEIKDNGDVRLGCSRKDWHSDAEMSVEMSVAEKKQGRVSSLNLAVQKALFGGGQLNVSLMNFHKVTGVLEIPFGLNRPGLNQIKIAYSMMYDARSSNMKQGLMFTV